MNIAAPPVRSTASSRWLTLAKLWLIYNAAASAGGWALSLLGALNWGGYLALSVPVIVAMALVIVRDARAQPRGISLRRLLHRFRRPLPLVYLLLLVGSLVGGALYAPSNYDMLTYRLPRMFHWLAAGRWHWIHANIDRMNYSGTGWEWASMPLLLLAHGTRLLFLLNIVSYLLLPGLFYAMLRSLRVGRRTAWYWMWILPAGLIFVMQAGGGANDAMAADFAIAAILFARLAIGSSGPAAIAWSMLAAAELSAAKASNLPLMLPCAVALAPAIIRHRRAILSQPARWLAIGILVIFSSIAPLLALNWHYTGDYAGSPNDEGKLKLHNPAAGLLGNGLMIVGWNLQPPVMPLASQWNALSPGLLPASMTTMLERDFPRFSMHMNELPQEEASGLGLALTVMAAIALLATVFNGRQGSASSAAAGAERAMVPAIFIASWVALAANMALIGSESAARLITPYYPLVLVPLLLSRVNDRLARRRWWRCLAAVATASALPALVLTPSRPLFPAVRWTAALRDRFPHSATAARAADVYALYAARPDGLAPLRQFLPPQEKIVGFLAGGDDSETSLWLPVSAGRKVYDILPSDNSATLTAAGVRYAVVSAEGLSERGLAISEMLGRFHATVIAERKITLKVSTGPQEWYVVRVGT